MVTTIDINMAAKKTPAVSSLADGGWIVCWIIIIEFVFTQDIQCQRYDSNGEKCGFFENFVTMSMSVDVDVKGLPNGGWVIVSNGVSGSNRVIFARIYDSNGVLVSVLDEMKEFDLNYLQTPRIDSFSDGGFCVSWIKKYGYNPGIAARCFKVNLPQEPLPPPVVKRYWCWNAWSDQSFVCSKHGTCIGTNQCKCDENYSGRKCDYFSCFGLGKDNPNVCSGFGKCISHDVCVCNAGFSNPLGGCNSCDNSNCHGVGNCVFDEPNTYHCENCGNGISGAFCEDCIVSGKSGKHQDNVCYVSYHGRMNLDWQESRDFCKENFHPASDIPVLPSEASLIAFLEVTGSRSAWILLSDGEGSWEWKDGVTPYDWTNWNPNNPNQYGDCAYVHRSYGKYLNYYCSNKVATEAVTCSINMNDESSLFSLTSLLNVGYSKYDFSSGWCDWSVADNCPDKYQKCNGIKQGEEGVCSNNGTCTYIPSERRNRCVCSNGFSGSDCEAVDEPISGMECEILNGYCYKLFEIGSVGVGWNVARDYCKDNWDAAADLATIPNWEVQTLVSSLVGDESVWIGALDFEEGNWQWVDHSPMTFTYWHKKDDGGKFGEDCAAMEGQKIYDSGWTTNNCASPKAFVCSLKIADAGTGASSIDWINVRYKDLNTASASCSCSNLPCPSSGCS